MQRRRSFLLAAAALVSLVNFSPAQSQTLTEKLRGEDAAALARAAREEGNGVRGAILFAQKKLKCTACHAQGATDLLGPDLTRTGNEVDDRYFVESILDPSKIIKKGFESVRVLTRDGRLVVGRIIDENDDAVLLRDNSEVSRRMSLPRENIEAIQSNEKSTMPDALADQLENRTQFLDLVKYLMDIAATGPAAAPSHALGGGKVDERIRGMKLLDELGCMNCHAAAGHEIFPRRRAPDLTFAGSRIDPHYIRRFIADPLHIKPGTSMPDVIGRLDDGERERVADAITQYLVSLSETTFRRQPCDLKSASRGNELFHTVGCVACHSPRDDEGIESLAEDSVPLGDLNARYSLEGLIAFLEDPHSVRPSGRMPGLSLTHWEATDIANYLLSREPAQAATPVPQRDALVAAGKRDFNRLGCVHCHNPGEATVPTRSPALEALRTDRGCLSTTDGDWPRYDFDTSELAAIRRAIETFSDELSDEQQIQWTMETFRCYACHQRGDIGGVSDNRDLFFHTTNPNLGPQGRIPPRLTGVGAKLKPKWMRQVLVSGRAIRPYLKTRMPQYGSENVAHLVELFQRVDELPEIEFGDWKDQKEAKKAGTELVGSAGLNCVACHTFQMKSAQTMPAVDLTEMAERLHKKWFYRYMLAPQSLSPNTVMPSFWPGGRAIRKDLLDGNVNQQLEAIWIYLLDGRQARVPRGLVIEPIELLATDEAVMLRRNYQGIGKRGIGVGYPRAVNLAFDAEQMRLGMIWKGRFADPGGVWRGQGSGTVRPLGDDLIRFEPGPDIDDHRSPWVVDDGRPPEHQFTGYHLDELQRPTFTYRFRDVEIEDYSVDVIDAEGNSSLKRAITFSSAQNRSGIAFRLSTKEPIAAEDDRTFVIGGKLRVVVDDDHTGKIVETGSANQLVIPLKITAGKTELVLDYVW